MPGCICSEEHHSPYLSSSCIFSRIVSFTRPLYPFFERNHSTISGSRRIVKGFFLGAFWGPRPRFARANISSSHSGLSGSDAMPASIRFSSASESISILRLLILSNLSPVGFSHRYKTSGCFSDCVSNSIKAIFNQTQSCISAFFKTCIQNSKSSCPVKILNLDKINTVLGDIGCSFLLVPFVIHNFIVRRVCFAVKYFVCTIYYFSSKKEHAEKS